MLCVPQYSRTLTTITNTSQIDRFKITPQNLVQAANKILAPYKISYKHCHWWTAYRIGQRVGSKFTAHERVFLAGDAVHTHSPKAGQGMNISMHDSEFRGVPSPHKAKVSNFTYHSSLQSWLEAGFCRQRMGEPIAPQDI